MTSISKKYQLKGWTRQKFNKVKRSFYQKEDKIIRKEITNDNVAQ